MQLSRVVQVRKLLFIRSILALDDETLSRKIFIERAKVFYGIENHAPLDDEWSIVGNLLNVASVFRLDDEV